MGVNAAWIAELRERKRLADVAELTVMGVVVDMPVGGKKKGNTWQGRVLDDVLPDSPVADAPEKTPSQILRALTDPQEAEHKLAEVLEDGELAPLAPLFLFETRGKRTLPVGFHVLATRAVKKKMIESRAFTERTFKLLMRDESGEIDLELVERFVDYFRAPMSDLDLAQRTVLERVQPGWDPARHHLFNPPALHGPTPFVPQAGALLRRDLRRLLDARLSRADFFRYVNRLLALHFGLYQPRLATVLNPAMRVLETELASPGSTDLDELMAIEEGRHPAHRFEASIRTQAPAAGDHRPMRDGSPLLLAYREVARGLNELHFSLLVLNRIRDLGRGWLVHRGYEADAAEALPRKPSWFVREMRREPDFRAYFETALEALSVRFILNQIAETSRDVAFDDVHASSSGLSALFELYRRYNREVSPKASSARSVKAGEGVVRRLLGTGESGLLRVRPRIGAYFEVGAGLLPLLLLTTIDTGLDKLPVRRFWSEVERYGLRLSPEEQERLLLRLKSMGLYERYSDAGAASYVRSMLASPETLS